MTTNTSQSGLLRSGQLARQAGVSRDTLRHYERRGLLMPAGRTSNGYRYYRPEALGRVRLVRAALSIGFSLEELARILRARDRGLAPCKEVRELAGRKLEALEAQLRELQTWRDQLLRTLSQWDKSLHKVQPGRRAGLLEAFVAANPGNAERLSPLLTQSLRRKLGKKERQR